ncbi:hypothetical protein TSMEX_010746 [Taenia solium]|eukprot:TsM_000134500 transcript=TsM_000134500 gene=TsM_000134500
MSGITAETPSPDQPPSLPENVCVTTEPSICDETVDLQVPEDSYLSECFSFLFYVYNDMY